MCETGVFIVRNIRPSAVLLLRLSEVPWRHGGAIGISSLGIALADVEFVYFATRPHDRSHFPAAGPARA